ncbi:hypothetical protein [Kordia sp.]|uniref:hypothetical protein n=1 Tax=Kordia sp. TaxID=1965332 RepID=UPI003B5C3A09
MNDKIKTVSLLLSGFLTYPLSFIIPIGGGGASTIFLLSIPFFIVMGIIYHVFIRKIKNPYYKNGIFLAMLLLIISLTFAWYPYV